MSCTETARRLGAYIDGELDLGQSLAIETHLASCARCRAGERGLRALRHAIREHTEIRPAPAHLLRRISQRADAAPLARPDRRAALRTAAVAAAGFGAGVAATWLGTMLLPAAPTRDGRNVLYHMASSANASAVLRTLHNHLEAAPESKVVVVAHNDGIDFLLRGAHDEADEPFRGRIAEFRRRGVEFRVCGNTLERRRITAADFIPEVSFVPSGIAEIARLQAEEAYVYMRM